MTFFFVIAVRWCGIFTFMSRIRVGSCNVRMRVRVAKLNDVNGRPQQVAHESTHMSYGVNAFEVFEWHHGKGR